MKVTGFRAPASSVNNDMYVALGASDNVTYDSSLIQMNANGQYFWPYTLDYGSPVVTCVNHCLQFQ